MNSLSSSSHSSKVNKTYSKDSADLVAINEKVNLTKDQHEVLNIICKAYQISISEYMQEALVEAMKFDIGEGNFCDTLLEKIGNEDKGKNNSPSSPAPLAPDLMNSDLDLFKKLQT
jgi:sulfur relay (sulfurtransferase) DsrC/TusE family protein